MTILPRPRPRQLYAFVTALIASAAVSIASAATANAADYQDMTLADGTSVTYALVLPADFDPNQSYPAILAFPPGPQTRAMVDAGLNGYWEAEARRRGFIVVSPVAPGGDLFFRGSASLVHEFLDRIDELLPIKDHRFHVAGISNGGLSAFRAALDHPDLFLSLTALPGFPPGENDLDRLANLSEMTVNMFVGEFDGGWVSRMQNTADLLTDLGHPPLFEILPGEGHVMQAIAGTGASRLFDLLPD